MTKTDFLNFLFASDKFTFSSSVTLFMTQTCRYKEKGPKSMEQITAVWWGLERWAINCQFFLKDEDLEMITGDLGWRM